MCQAQKRAEEREKRRSDKVPEDFIAGHIIKNYMTVIVWMEGYLQKE